MTRKLKITKKKNKKVLKISKRINLPDKKTLIVMNFSRFYDEFVKENGISPDKFIDKIDRKILMLYYHYKYDIYDTIDEKVDILETLIMNDKSSYDKYIYLYMEISYGKLLHLKLWDTMQAHMNKLYEVLHYLLNDHSVEIPLDYSLMDIYIRGQYFLNSSKQNKLKGDTFVKKENIILETSKNETIDINNEHYKGSKVFLEYANNRYLSIPILFYKRLSNIEWVDFKYKIYNIPFEDSEGDDPYEERILEADIQEKAFDIEKLINIVYNLERYQKGFLLLEEHNINYLESMDFDITIHTKDECDQHYDTFEKFGDYYFGFIDK